MSLSTLLTAILLGLFAIPPLARLTGGGSAVAGAFAFLPFGVLVYAVVVIVNRGRLLRPHLSSALLPFVIWSCVLLVSIARSNNASHSGGNGVLLTLLWGSVLLVIFIVAADITRRSHTTVDSAMHGLVLAVGVFVSINVVLHLAGVTSREVLLVDHPEGRIAGFLGLRVERTLLPLARGVNNFGVIAGMGIAVSVAGLIAPSSSHLRRMLHGFLAIGCSAAIILVDSRGPLVFGIVSGLATPIAYRIGRGRSVRWIALAAPLLPVTLLALLTTIATSDLASAISRQQGDIASATGRAFIWSAAAGRLVLAPNTMDAIGYGQYGAKGAGVSSSWASAFRDFEDDPTLTSTHNLSLQLIYDSGYLGLAVALGVLWWTLGALELAYRTHGLGSAVLLATALCYVILAGTTEATISILFPEVLVFLTLALAISGFLGARPPARPKDADV